jgi:anaerobic selenocysteine-containing dehydrogenase
MPSCTWAEKSGVYENFEGRIQPFELAIPPLEDTRSTGRIFWDLLGTPGTYTAVAARNSITKAGLTGYADLVIPRSTIKVEDMEFAAL